MDYKTKQECIEIKELLYAYVDNELSASQSRRVLNHIQECKSCADAVSNMYKVNEMIKSSYMPKEKIDFSKSIMMNIKVMDKYNKNNKSKTEKKYILPYVLQKKLVYIMAAASMIIFAIGATVAYFENIIPVSQEVAEHTYDKYEDYVIEHYSNSYAVPSITASVVTVNFEK